MGLLEKWVPKGSLCDGHVHVNAHEMFMRKCDAWKFHHRRTLVKLANNPILSAECRDALWKAVHDFDADNWWRNLYQVKINRERLLREDRTNETKIYYKYKHLFCSTCGSEVLKDFRFCPGCGKMISPFTEDK